MSDNLLGSLVGISGIAILVLLSGAGVYGLVKQYQRHHQAYVDLQVSKGMSETDALLDYQNKFRGS